MKWSHENSLKLNINSRNTTLKEKGRKKAFLILYVHKFASSSAIADAVFSSATRAQGRKITLSKVVFMMFFPNSFFRTLPHYIRITALMSSFENFSIFKIKILIENFFNYFKLNLITTFSIMCGKTFFSLTSSCLEQQ